MITVGGNSSNFSFSSVYPANRHNSSAVRHRSLIFAGHYLDRLFMDQFGIDLKSHLEMIIIIIVLITTVPIIVKFFFGKKKEETDIEE